VSGGDTASVSLVAGRLRAFLATGLEIANGTARLGAVVGIVTSVVMMGMSVFFLTASDVVLFSSAKLSTYKLAQKIVICPSCGRILNVI
jgi:hypothetical protein